MSNPYRDYKTNFNNNLPTGITYDAGIARYIVNDKRFTRAFEAQDYLNYIIKFGFLPTDALLLESGDAILLESGGPILLESGDKPLTEAV